MISYIFQIILLFIAIHLIRILQNIKINLILINSGNGVGLKYMKDIKYIFQNIMLQKTLLISGRKMYHLI